MLETRDLSAAHGRHPALRGVSLSVNRGAIVVILGANGAGKPTLPKAISGIREGRATGSVTLRGEELAGLPPSASSRRGSPWCPRGGACSAT